MADTLGMALAQARKRLGVSGVENPAWDARLIVEHFAGATRADLMAEPGRPLLPETAAAIEAAVARRTLREPVHRILGFRDFYGLRLALSPATLEPRPDTETLVDAALPFVRAVIARTGGCRILDLGTGTGAIALALLSEAPQALATGVDSSDAALETARENARNAGLASRFETLRSDWLADVNRKYHIIVANPPYIATSELESLQDEVRLFDPRLALDGGSDGLDAYRRIAADADRYLENEGRVLVEVGFGQAAPVAGLFEQAGYRIEAFSRDLAGIERVLTIQPERAR